MTATTKKTKAEMRKKRVEALVLSPSENTLEVNKSYAFEVFARGALRVVLVDDEARRHEFRHEQAYAKFWTLSHAFAEPGLAKIFVQFERADDVDADEEPPLERIHCFTVVSGGSSDRGVYSHSSLSPDVDAARLRSTSSYLEPTASARRSASAVRRAPDAELRSKSVVFSHGRLSVGSDGLPVFAYELLSPGMEGAALETDKLHFFKIKCPDAVDVRLLDRENEFLANPTNKFTKSTYEASVWSLSYAFRRPTRVRIYVKFDSYYEKYKCMSSFRVVEPPEPGPASLRRPSALLRLKVGKHSITEQTLNRRLHRLIALNGRSFPRLDDFAFEFAESRQLVCDLLNDHESVRYAAARRQVASLQELEEFVRRAPVDAPIQRLWVLYVWLAYHMSAPGGGKRRRRSSSRSLSDYEDDEALNSVRLSALLRHGRCESSLDFAQLFYKIATGVCRLNCKIIYGFCRRVNESSRRRGVLEAPNHAWNVLEFAGKWYLVDCKSAINARCQFQPFYFLCPLQAFASTHYSEWLRWSSSSSAPTTGDSLADFLARPLLNIDFYVYSLRPIQPDLSSSQAGALKFEYSAPESTLLVAYLIEEDEDDGGQSDVSAATTTYRKLVKNSTLVQRRLDTRNLLLRVALPASSLGKQYKLILYAKDPGTRPPIYLTEPRHDLLLDEDFTSVAEYTFRPERQPALKAARSRLKFIWFFDPEITRFCHVVKPVEHYLAVDREHTFEVCAPQASAVSLELKKLDVLLEFMSVGGEGSDRWLLKCIFEQTDTAVLHIKFDGHTGFTKVCSYLIVDSDY